MTIEAAARACEPVLRGGIAGRLLLVMLIRSGTLALRHAVRMGGLIGISGLIGVWIVIFWCHKMSFLLQKSAVSHAVCQKSYSKDFIM